jgi:hypothetical protein
LYLPILTWAQFPPPAGQPGSTAIFRDSSIIINWAKTCSIHLGYIDITDTNQTYGGSNKANYGIASDALGESDDHVVSLGDGGIATLTFDPPISNGIGFDFTVFENGLNDVFLELGFVEVSSDGFRFVRFSSTSMTPESPQIGTFGFLDATRINNLAGKYRIFFGTPFDLEELTDSSGLDIMHITHVRIIDVVGCVTSSYTTFDSFGHKINDPWPTRFHTGGFDLDAVGVIHESSQTIADNQKYIVQVYPNPFQNQLRIKISRGDEVIFHLVNFLGEIVANEKLTAPTLIDLTTLNPGLYIGQFTFPDGRMEIHKIIKR